MSQNLDKKASAYSIKVGSHKMIGNITCQQWQYINLPLYGLLLVVNYFIKHYCITICYVFQMQNQIEKYASVGKKRRD